MNRAAKKERILAVDDSADTLEVLRRNLTSHGYQVLTAGSVEEAVGMLESNPVDVVVTDLKMPGSSGLDLVRHVRENYRDTEVLMITGYPTVESAVQAVKIGAQDYLAKPFTEEELLGAVQAACDKLRTRRAMQKPVSPISPTYIEWLGSSESMRPVLRTIEKAITATAPVLICGEPGVGKEIIGRAIHYSSPRAPSPFVVAHCSAIPPEWLEKELFGSVHDGDGDGDGAPPRVRPGLVQGAGSGTLFLPDVCVASSVVQAKLVPLIRTREFWPVGASYPLQSEARIIATTSKDPSFLVDQGLLRKDLFYCLRVIDIRIPPLRERADDILPLARLFALRYAKEQGRPEPKFTDRTLKVLQTHGWPGNVRELENTVQRLVIMSDSDTIDVPDLPTLMRFSALRDRGVERSLAQVEAAHIREVLRSVNNNQSRAAEILGIDRKTLREKLKRILKKESEGAGT